MLTKKSGWAKVKFSTEFNAEFDSAYKKRQLVFAVPWEFDLLDSLQLIFSLSRVIIDAIVII